MSPEVAPMVVMVTAILTTGGVLIFRPIARRLGALLDVTTAQKMKALQADPNEVTRIRELLTSIDGRLTMLEERQDFAEALISAGEPRMLSVQRPQQAERN